MGEAPKTTTHEDLGETKEIKQYVLGAGKTWQFCFFSLQECVLDSGLRRHRPGGILT